LVTPKVSLDQGSKNFAGSGGKASTNYKAGTLNKDWATPAGSDNAQANFRTRMSDPTVIASRQKRIQAVGNSKWQAGTQGKGATNISSGIAGGGPAWKTGMSPVYDDMASFTLQPKTTDAATNYDNNAKALGVLLQNNARKRKAAGT